MGKNERRAKSLKQKVEFIKKLELNKDQSRIVNRGVASRSVISRIWKKREDILLAYTSRPLMTKKVKSL